MDYFHFLESSLCARIIHSQREYILFHRLILLSVFEQSYYAKNPITAGIIGHFNGGEFSILYTNSKVAAAGVAIRLNKAVTSLRRRAKRIIHILKEN